MSRPVRGLSAAAALALLTLACPADAAASHHHHAAGHMPSVRRIATGHHRVHAKLARLHGACRTSTAGFVMSAHQRHMKKDVADAGQYAPVGKAMFYPDCNPYAGHRWRG